MNWTYAFHNVTEIAVIAVDLVGIESEAVGNVLVDVLEQVKPSEFNCRIKTRSHFLNCLRL